jgi:hypothetical protein
MIVLAVDIGLTGALAAVDSRQTCSVLDLPTLEDGKTRRIDGKALIFAIRALVPIGETATLVIEDVRPRSFGNQGKQTNSMHSQGSMMRSRGIVEAVCDIARVQIKLVQPQTWKRSFGLIGKDKDAGREVALRLYPQAAGELKLKKHHNRADAILIAHWGCMEAMA